MLGLVETRYPDDLLDFSVLFNHLELIARI